LDYLPNGENAAFDQFFLAAEQEHGKGCGGRRRGSFAQCREKQLAGRAFNAAGGQNRISAAKTHEAGPLTGDTVWTDRRAEPISLCVAIVTVRA